MENGALEPLLKVFHPEDRDRVVLDVLAEVRLPPHAVVDRHPARQTPRILRIRAEVPVVDEQEVLAPMLEGRHTADEEIREAEAGCRTVDDPAAVGARRGRVLSSPELRVRADAELV